MLKYILFFILIACGTKAVNDSKKENKEPSQKTLNNYTLYKKMYKNNKDKLISFTILKGKFEELIPIFLGKENLEKIDNEVKIFTKEIEYKAAEYAEISRNLHKNDLEKAREVFKEIKQYEGAMDDSSLKASLRKALKYNWEKEQDKIVERIKEWSSPFYNFVSFIVDSYIISKENKINISFEDYTRIFMEEIKNFHINGSNKVRDFINSTEKEFSVYFYVYDTPEENYQKTFIKVFNEVFSN